MLILFLFNLASSSNEVTKFRVVGGSLVWFCTCASENTRWKWTSFLGETGTISVIHSIVYMSKHFNQRVKSSNSIYPQNGVIISPVAFGDAGKYQLLDYEKNINIITIQGM